MAHSDRRDSRVCLATLFCLQLDDGRGSGVIRRGGLDEIGTNCGQGQDYLLQVAQLIGFEIDFQKRQTGGNTKK